MPYLVMLFGFIGIILFTINTIPKEEFTVNNGTYLNVNGTYYFRKGEEKVEITKEQYLKARTQFTEP